MTATHLPCGRKRPKRSAPPTRSAWINRLDTHCAERGLKQSQVRTKIAAVALTLREHFDVALLIAELKRRRAPATVATVYRTVGTLVDAGLIEESYRDEENRTWFERTDLGGSSGTSSHHDHLVCLDCGASFEFRSEAIEREQRSILLAEGFTEARHRHVVYGRCARLTKKNQSP